MHAHLPMGVLLLLAISSGAQTPAASDDFKADMQKLADDWRQAFNAMDVDKLASTFTPDAELLVPRGDVRGRAAILDEYREETAEEGAKLSALTVTRAVRSGSFAYITGTYAGTGGGTQPGTGHFVSVLKRIGGKWLIAATASVPRMEK